MKKLIVLFLSLCMLLSFSTASAVTAERGQTVEIPISLSNKDAVYVQVKISYNSSVFENVTLTATKGYATGTSWITISQLDVISSGKCGVLKLTVKADAPAGSYTIGASVYESWNSDEDKGTVSASGGTVEVKAPACKHNYNTVIDQEATCGAKGHKTMTCSKCGDVQGEDIPATGKHTYTVVTEEPTCGKDGLKTSTCSVCGDVQTETLSKTGKHTYTVVTEEPTCGKTGLKTSTCSVCGDVQTETIPKLKEHSYNAGEIKTPVSCFTNGLKVYTCTVCGDTKDEVIKAPKKHTPDKSTEQVETAPTCTTNGKSSYTCSVCGEKVEGGVIEALGHDKIEKTTAPTCVTPGKTVITCSRCDYEKTTTIPATKKHTNETKVTTEPTCGTAGVETTTCTVCGKTSTKSIPATKKHTYEEKVEVAPTCTGKGKAVFTCSVCGDSYSKTIPANGHTPGADLNEKKPTCTKPGYKYYTCSVCGDDVKESSIPATKKHIYEVTEEVPATCTTAGKRVSKCTYEGCTKTKTETLKKLGHKMGEWTVTIAPSCDKKGEEMRECLNGCGKTETRVLKASHNWGEWNIDEANGIKNHVCSACGKSETKNLANYYSMNVCSYGIRFRDLDKSITKDWYMFTPIDLSVEGEQTVDLIAGNMHKIGTAAILVKEGTVTVTTKVNNTHSIAYTEEFLTFVPSLAELTKLDFDAMTNYAYGEEISIEEDLGGDTKVLLVMCNKAWYADGSRGVNSFKGKGKDYEAYVEELKQLMD